MRGLGRLAVRILAGIGALVVLLVVLAVVLASRFDAAVNPTLPKRFVLSLDLDRDFPEGEDGGALAALSLSSDKTVPLRDAVRLIEAAAADPKVAGLFATMGDLKTGMARTQDLRDAVARFRASGKPAVVFSDSLGEGGGGSREAVLASAFSSVWLQPSGTFGFSGMIVESPFLKDMLTKLGIQPAVAARHEYKSAVEIVTENGFSLAHRETMDRLLDSWSQQVTSAVAAGRKLAPERVQALFGTGPLLAEDAKSAGLVDHLGYRDQALAEVRGGDADLPSVDLGGYRRAEAAVKTGPKLAVITGAGTIHRGTAHEGFGGDPGFGAATVARAVRDAAADHDVKAIILRIDSPGGSYVASDTVWHEVVAARAKGKPVVASFGDVAASGGYFVAMAADRVVAEPGTVTGSIGVFAGKLVLTDFWDKLGVHFDEMHRGDNAGMFSFNRPFTPSQWARLNGLLDHIYQDFTTKAVSGRKIPADRIDSLARGRVWSGQDALQSGLVDALGGWDVTLAEARRLVGAAPDSPVQIEVFPRPRPGWERLGDLLSDDGDLHVWAGLAARVQTLLERAGVFGPSLGGLP